MQISIAEFSPQQSDSPRSGVKAASTVIVTRAVLIVTNFVAGNFRRKAGFFREVVLSLAQTVSGVNFKVLIIGNVQDADVVFLGLDTGGSAPPATSIIDKCPLWGSSSTSSALPLPFSGDEVVVSAMLGSEPGVGKEPATEILRTSPPFSLSVGVGTADDIGYLLAEGLLSESAPSGELPPTTMGRKLNSGRIIDVTCELPSESPGELMVTLRTGIHTGTSYMQVNVITCNDNMYRF